MKRRRLLLVDDSSVVLMIEQMILGRGPYDLLFARHGAEAVELARHERPDLVLMDVEMPGMSGLEAVRRLRADAVTREVPIVLVTARDEPRAVEAGFASGCDDYVVKPLQGRELLDKIARLLEARP